MHSQAYSVNSVPFFQDGKALKEGSVTVATQNRADESFTHNRNSLVSLYGDGNLHFPLHHSCDQRANEHENFFELFSAMSRWHLR